MRKYLTGIVLALLALLSVNLLNGRAAPETSGYPVSIAALGDSISQGFDTDSSHTGDHPEFSWSIGTVPSVNSHYTRILSASRAISGNFFDDAVSGSVMANFAAQVNAVNAQHVKYLTILLGANDVCTTSEANMTSPATFQAQFEAGMQSLSVGSPDARIYVSSIPNIYNLWSVLHTDPSAVQVWGLANICQSMLANPTSMAQADIDRRARVQQREVDFNTILRNVCDEYIHCRFDNNVGYNTNFLASEVSSYDYFHPSLAGQTRVASISYDATFDFTDAVAPVSRLVSATHNAGSLSVVLTATDNVSVAGIEYKIGRNADHYTRYSGPLLLDGSAPLLYRAVDVNGNVEATHTINVVTSVLDSGDSTVTKTLSFALAQSQDISHSVVYFALNSGNTVTVTGTLPPVLRGVVVDGGCSGGPTVTIQGGLGTGLSLQGGDTLNGLKIRGFAGRQIVTVGTGNKLSCVTISKT